MSETHTVVVVPGFFGFQTLGALSYFVHVEEILTKALADVGIAAQVQVVGTLPTSSLRSRASKLAEAVAPLAARTAGPVHLVGHSSGGLDIRLLLTPGGAIPTSVDVEALAARVRTAVTVATPHYGTPLATFLTGVQGHRMLKVLSAVTSFTLRFGSQPLGGAVKLGKVLLRLDDIVGLRDTVLDQLYEGLLDELPGEHRESVQEFLGHVLDDHALAVQLTPAAIDMFNAGVGDRPGVRYGCVVTQARRPGVGTVLSVGFDPYAQVTQAIYQALYRVNMRMPLRQLGAITDQQAHVLTLAYGQLPDASANDGMIPTRSQLWGHAIHAARADHLDVMGYFDDHSHDPPHVDWLSTGSGFKRPDFEALWRDVAHFIASGQHPEED